MKPSRWAWLAIAAGLLVGGLIVPTPAGLSPTGQRALAQADRLRAQTERADALLARIQRLTPREKQVFALVVRGMLNKQIAHEMGTSERTVKAHRHMVMEKCGVRSVAELVMIAERTGMMPADGIPAKNSAPRVKMSATGC